MQTGRHTGEQIVAKLGRAEVELAEGRTVPQVSNLLGITEQTCHRWRNAFGGLRLDQAGRLKQLEQENTRPKKVVPDLTLDNAMLKEVADPNFFRRHIDGSPRRRACVVTNAATSAVVITSKQGDSMRGARRRRSSSELTARLRVCSLRQRLDICSPGQTAPKASRRPARHR